MKVCIWAWLRDVTYLSDFVRKGYKLQDLHVGKRAALTLTPKQQKRALTAKKSLARQSDERDRFGWTTLHIPGNGSRPPKKCSHCQPEDHLLRARASTTRRSFPFCPLQELLGTFASSLSTWHSAMSMSTNAYCSQGFPKLHLKSFISENPTLLKAKAVTLLKKKLS